MELISALRSPRRQFDRLAVGAERLLGAAQPVSQGADQTLQLWVRGAGRQGSRQAELGFVQLGQFERRPTRLAPEGNCVRFHQRGLDGSTLVHHQRRGRIAHPSVNAGQPFHQADVLGGQLQHRFPDLDRPGIIAHVPIDLPDRDLVGWIFRFELRRRLKSGEGLVVMAQCGCGLAELGLSGRVAGVQVNRATKGSRGYLNLAQVDQNLSGLPEQRGPVAIAHQVLQELDRAGRVAPRPLQEAPLQQGLLAVGIEVPYPGQRFLGREKILGLARRPGPRHQPSQVLRGQSGRFPPGLGRPLPPSGCLTSLRHRILDGRVILQAGGRLFQRGDSCLVMAETGTSDADSILKVWIGHVKPDRQPISVQGLLPVAGRLMGPRQPFPGQRGAGQALGGRPQKLDRAPEIVLPQTEPAGIEQELTIVRIENGRLAGRCHGLGRPAGAFQGERERMVGCSIRIGLSDPLFQSSDGELVMPQFTQDPAELRQRVAGAMAALVEAQQGGMCLGEPADLLVEQREVREERRQRLFGRRLNPLVEYPLDPLDLTAPLIETSQRQPGGGRPVSQFGRPAKVIERLVILVQSLKSAPHQDMNLGPLRIQRQGCLPGVNGRLPFAGRVGIVHPGAQDLDVLGLEVSGLGHRLQRVGQASLGALNGGEAEQGEGELFPLL